MKSLYLLCEYFNITLATTTHSINESFSESHLHPFNFSSPPFLPLFSLSFPYSPLPPPPSPSLPSLRSQA